MSGSTFNIDGSDDNVNCSSKRKFDALGREFWSVQGEGEPDPYFDLVLVVKSTSTTPSPPSSSILTKTAYCVHRSTLGRNSEYFDTLFRGNFREGREKSDRVEIELNPMVAQCFEIILQYIYEPSSITFKLGSCVEDGRYWSKVVLNSEDNYKVLNPQNSIPVAHSTQALGVLGLYTLILDQFKVEYPKNIQIYPNIQIQVGMSSPDLFRNPKTVIAEDRDRREKRELMMKRDKVCWKEAKDLGMDELEKQILWNLMTNYEEGMFDDSEIFESAIDYLGNLHLQNKLPTEIRSRLSYTFTSDLFLLGAVPVTKSIFDKFFISPVGIDGDEAIRLVVGTEDCPPPTCLYAHEFLCLHEQFYPSTWKSLDKKVLTKLEGIMVKFLLEKKWNADEVKGTKEYALEMQDSLQGLPNHILVAIGICNFSGIAVDDLVIGNDDEEVDDDNDEDDADDDVDDDNDDNNDEEDGDISKSKSSGIAWDEFLEKFVDDDADDDDDDGSWINPSDED